MIDLGEDVTALVEEELYFPDMAANAQLLLYHISIIDWKSFVCCPGGE